MPPSPPLGRRDLARRVAAGLAAASPAWAEDTAATRKSALVLGLDMIDTATFDPARQVNYSPPMTLAACYDTLVTMAPGHYDEVQPSLAIDWARTPDDRGWRFRLHPEATFATGNKVTPDDCVFSLRRLLAIGDGPAHYLEAIVDIVPSGPGTVDILLDDPDHRLLSFLAAPSYAIMEKAVIEAQNGTALPDAASADRATPWLDQHSAGSGPYVLTEFVRRSHIRLQANPNAWRGKPGYAQVLLRHYPDTTAQMRALQKRDIDAAFNLVPGQLAMLQTDPEIRVQSTSSLDLVYLALNADPARNKALAAREARQAIGYAIDYDDVLGRLLGGTAVRPATFLPIGLPGSSEATLRQIGFRQDLDLARNLLAQAGLADGFGFDLAYADAGVAGLAYETLARKLRTDLARVGIAVRLVPLNPYSFRDAFLAGQTQAALAFWTSPIVDTSFWARASVERLGKRVGLGDAPALRDLIRRLSTTTAPEELAALGLDYQKALVSLANFVVLFQPSYQVAIRSSVQTLPLTAAGWMADLGAAKPVPASAG